ncbi:hypothetical protein GVAV_002909 [Gurleya vavrai]
MSNIYKWEQNHDDLIVTLDIPENSAKDIQINLTNCYLTVKLKNEIVLQKTYTKNINSDSLVWYVDDNILYITILKEKKEWWTNCFVGDEAIDVEEIAKNRPVGMEGMDLETQQMINKMMYEQQNKEKQTDEMKKKMQEMKDKGIFNDDDL